MPRETPINEVDKIGVAGWGSSPNKARGASVSFSRAFPTKILMTVLVAAAGDVVRAEVLDTDRKVVSTESFKALADDEQIALKTEAPTQDHLIIHFLNGERLAAV